jgi:transposase
VILDARVLQSTPESGSRAGYSGAKPRKGSKTHLAVDTVGHLLALSVTPASEDERTQVHTLATQVQEATGRHVEMAYVDAGYSGPEPAASAAAQGIELVVVKTPEAKRGFVLLPKRWVVERTQSQYLQSALDAQTPLSHDRTHWVAQPACRGRSTARSAAGLYACSTGSGCAMSSISSRPENGASAPPHPRERPGTASGSSYHQPIGNGSCVCSVVSSNGG